MRATKYFFACHGLGLEGYVRARRRVWEDDPSFVSYVYVAGVTVGGVDVPLSTDSFMGGSVGRVCEKAWEAIEAEKRVVSAGMLRDSLLSRVVDGPDVLRDRGDRVAEQRARRRASTLDLVSTERARQENLWPGHTCADDMDNGLRLAILTEEVGEVARELCEAAQHDRAVDIDKLRTELVQVAAIAVAWVESVHPDVT